MLKIADNLEVPYFTDEETVEFLGMHEGETGQLFTLEVKEKISAITSNQPGLVNGFAINWWNVIRIKNSWWKCFL